MIKPMLFICLSILIFGMFSWDLPFGFQEDSSYIIHEDFSDIENWENFSFSGNKSPTEYITQTDSQNTYLKIISQNSASGLIYKEHYNPNEYPILTWRWRVDNVVTKADGKVKSGDDYAITE